MKYLSFLTLLLTILFLGTVSAEAANQFVRAGASGSANGTDWTNAFTTLPANLTRGDTYFIADGSYPGRTFSTATSGATPITIKKATVANHGTDTGWDNTFGDGQAIFGPINFTTGNWVIDGMTGGGPGSATSWTTGFGFKISSSGASPLLEVSNSAADSITVRHIELQGTSNSSGGGSIAQDAISVRGGDGFTISYFYTHAIGRCPFFLVPAPNAVIEYGYIADFVSTSSQHSEVISTQGWGAGDLTFRYNVVTHVEGTGGIMWDNSGNHNSRLDIYGNVFYRNPSDTKFDNCCNGIIGGWTGGNGEDFFNAHVYNNSFININGAEVLSTFPSRAGNNEFRNNLFYTVSDVGGGTRVWQTGTHNHFISSTSVGTNSSTGSGSPFVNSASFDFRLTAGNTAGFALSAPYNVDMYGNTRGADGTWDRGAVEFGGGVADITPPLPPTNLRVQ